MNYRTAPALFPSAAFLAGAALASVHFEVSSPAPLVVLASLGLALGRLPGRCLVGLALGLLLGLGPAGQKAISPPDPNRPVAAVGVIVDHPRPLGTDAWRCRLRLSVWHQGTTVRPLARDVWLELGGEPPPLGTPVRVRGYWLESEPLGNGLPRPVGLPRLRVKSVQLLERTAEPGPIARLSGRLRDRLESSPSLVGDGLGAAFGRALVLGDPRGIPVRVRQGLGRLGLAHVLSVSGLHVGLVTALGLLLGRRAPRGGRLLPALLLVSLYLAAVGPLAPLLRSAGMAALAAAALLFERPPVAANALAVMALVLVAAAPGVIGELSFVLSLAATAGLVLGAPALLERWGREAPGPLVRGVAVTFSAQLATAPWTLPVFCLFTPWAALANLLAAPWIALLLAASLGAAILGIPFPTIGAAALPWLDRLAAPAAWLAAVPVSPWVATPLFLPAGIAAGLALAIGAAMLWPRRGLPIALGVALIAAGAFALGRPEPEVEIAFLDVGQGDGILLRDGARALLLDAGGSLGGGDFGGRVLLPVLARFGVTRLERVIVSHGDRDHCGGLVDLSGLVALGTVHLTADVAATPCGRSLADAANVVPFVAGDRLELGRWRLTVLHPPAAPPFAGNDGSLVIRAEAFGRSFLLTGDIEGPAEAALLASDGLQPVDVLKLAHHGSKSSTSRRFLERVAPHLAIVSAGRRNAFGHPAAVVLDRLQRHGVRVLRTDRDGAVVIRLSPDGRCHLSLPGSPK